MVFFLFVSQKNNKHALFNKVFFFSKKKENYLVSAFPIFSFVSLLRNRKSSKTVAKKSFFQQSYFVCPKETTWFLRFSFRLATNCQHHTSGREKTTTQNFTGTVIFSVAFFFCSSRSYLLSFQQNKTFFFCEISNLLIWKISCFVKLNFEGDTAVGDIGGGKFIEEMEDNQTMTQLQIMEAHANKEDEVNCFGGGEVISPFFCCCCY